MVLIDHHQVVPMLSPDLLLRELLLLLLLQLLELLELLKLLELLLRRRSASAAARRLGTLKMVI
jgi:hypothetical protein